MNDIQKQTLLKVAKDTVVASVFGKPVYEPETDDPKLLAEEKRQLRLEDLLGFRRNPTNDTPLFKQFQSKAVGVVHQNERTAVVC